jgi:hypothetical protein
MASMYLLASIKWYTDANTGHKADCRTDLVTPSMCSVSWIKLIAIPPGAKGGYE